MAGLTFYPEDGCDISPKRRLTFDVLDTGFLDFLCLRDFWKSAEASDIRTTLSGSGNLCRSVPDEGQVHTPVILMFIGQFTTARAQLSVIYASFL